MTVFKKGDHVILGGSSYKDDTGTLWEKGNVAVIFWVGPSKRGGHLRFGAHPIDEDGEHPLNPVRKPGRKAPQKVIVWGNCKDLTIFNPFENVET